MRKIVYNIFIIMLLFICSLSLTSCKAIEAQKITSTGSSSEANAIPGTANSPGMNGEQRTNGNQRNRSNTNQNINGNLGSY